VLLVIAADVGAYFADAAWEGENWAPRVSRADLGGRLGGLSMVLLVAWGGAVHFGLPLPSTVIFRLRGGVFPSSAI